jgi:hypothetical protein
MRSARVRLWLAAGLFLFWMGWLGYLAATATRPVVLSRPQLMVSTLIVVARVEATSGRPLPSVTVLEVLYPPNAHAGEKLNVTNLADCEGWQGPGDYLLPLVKAADDVTYEVARTPRSPGVKPQALEPRIYRYQPALRWQLEQVGK